MNFKEKTKEEVKTMSMDLNRKLLPKCIQGNKGQI